MAEPAHSCTTYVETTIGKFPELLQRQYSDFQPHHLPGIARKEYSVDVYNVAINVMVKIQKEKNHNNPSAKVFTAKKTYDSIEINITSSPNDKAYRIVVSAIKKFLEKYLKKRVPPYFDKITFNDRIVLSLEKPACNM